MRYLITGFNGFVARHLTTFIQQKEPESFILGIDKNIKTPDAIGKITTKCIDLTDFHEVFECLRMNEPDIIIHLATEASGFIQEWENPLKSFKNNLDMAINLIESIRQLNIPCKFINIGSSKQYKKGNDVNEKSDIEDNSIYSITKNTQEKLCMLYHKKYAISPYFIRPFNSFGQGQSDLFLIPSIFKQFKENKETITIENNSLIDFTDIRDLVKAIYLIMKGGKIANIYNICSGKGIRIVETIELISKLYDRKVNILIKNENDTILTGDNSKIKIDLAWFPEYSLNDSLKWIKEKY